MLFLLISDPPSPSKLLWYIFYWSFFLEGGVLLFSFILHGPWMVEFPISIVAFSLLVFADTKTNEAYHLGMILWNCDTWTVNSEYKKDYVCLMWIDWGKQPRSDLLNLWHLNYELWMWNNYAYLMWIDINVHIQEVQLCR